MTNRNHDYTSQNSEPRNEEPGAGKRQQDGGEDVAGKQSGKSKTEVKNAHAAGDGAIGPNDTRMPDVEENQENQHTEDPPY